MTSTGQEKIKKHIIGVDVSKNQWGILVLACRGPDQQSGHLEGESLHADGENAGACERLVAAGKPAKLAITAACAN